MMKKAYRVFNSDNVAMLLQDVAAGEAVTVTGKNLEDGAQQIVAGEDIQAGHKIALSDIGSGELVLKYGAVIGATITAIKAGRHVHTHNLGGLRGRGDRK